MDLWSESHASVEPHKNISFEEFVNKTIVKSSASRSPERETKAEPDEWRPPKVYMAREPHNQGSSELGTRMELHGDSVFGDFANKVIANLSDSMEPP